MHRFEIYELLRKLTLVGLMIFVMPETVTQIAVGLLVSILALGVHLQLQPFKEPSDNQDQTFALSGILLTLFAALLLATRTTKNEWENIQVLCVALIALNVGVVCMPPARLLYQALRGEQTDKEEETVTQELDAKVGKTAHAADADITTGADDISVGISAEA